MLPYLNCINFVTTIEYSQRFGEYFGSGQS
jgi:hypothetical protein